MTFTIKSQYEFLRQFLKNTKDIVNLIIILRVTIEFVQVQQEESDPKVTILETF